MEFSKERILEWQKIFKEKWGLKYTPAEVEKAANNLIGFFDLLFKIDKKKNPQNYIKK